MQSIGCFKRRVIQKLGKYERYITLGKCNIWVVKKKKETDHCSFSFTEKKIFLLDSENKEVEFIDDKKKKSVLNFKIELLQWIIEEKTYKEQKTIIEGSAKKLNCLKLTIEKKTIEKKAIKFLNTKKY